LKTERAWFFLKEKERGLQSSPDATLGRMDGTLEGCLLERISFIITKQKPAHLGWFHDS